MGEEYLLQYFGAWNPKRHCAREGFSTMQFQHLRD